MIKKTLPAITTMVKLLAIGLSLATPLHAKPEKPGEELTVRVMTYNVCRGGTHWGQPLSQSAKMIELAQADIVGLQEIGKNTVPELAKLLGWNHTETFLTRYEIVEEFKGGGRRPSHGIVVKLPSGQEVRVYSLHLPHGPYQPELLLGRTHPRYQNTIIKTEAEAIQNAIKNRAKHLARVLKPIDQLPNKEAPVFVIGDFNEPSHQDWTEAAAKAGRHPMKVDWPCSLMMAKAGFTDAYRTVHPDEMAKPGFTWSGAKPDVKPDDAINHSDRIDYVYFRGKGLKVTDAKVIGGNKENGDIVVAPYPSDHFAVVATLKLATPSGSDKPDAENETK